jgi:hypothetical protein
VTGSSRAGVELERAAVVTTYLLAAGVFLNAILVTGVAAILSIPDVFAETGAPPSLPVDNRSLSVLSLTCLPLALGLAVIARAAITSATADVVLIAFAVPCLLVTMWALYRYLWTNPGVY